MCVPKLNIMVSANVLYSFKTVLFTAYIRFSLGLQLNVSNVKLLDFETKGYNLWFPFNITVCIKKIKLLLWTYAVSTIQK